MDDILRINELFIQFKRIFRAEHWFNVMYFNIILYDLLENIADTTVNILNIKSLAHANFYKVVFNAI